MAWQAVAAEVAAAGVSQTLVSRHTRGPPTTARQAAPRLLHGWGLDAAAFSAACMCVASQPRVSCFQGYCCDHTAPLERLPGQEEGWGRAQGPAPAAAPGAAAPLLSSPALLSCGACHDAAPGRRLVRTAGSAAGVDLRTHSVPRSQAYFARAATTIQRWWRGYWSRTHVHSFYARKAYLASISSQNKTVRAEMKRVSGRQAPADAARAGGWPGPSRCATRACDHSVEPPLGLHAMPPAAVLLT